uniref:Uncharacterized protein n=1 Tax=Anguilla anguilla TaxID=7936 RepID=A0A0E9PIJ7_ANGAN
MLFFMDFFFLGPKILVLAGFPHSEKVWTSKGLNS